MYIAFGKQYGFNSFTLYHTIPTFNDPEKEAFRKHYEKRRKCWKPACPFPTIFSTYQNQNPLFQPLFNFVSANVFILEQSENLSFGTELTNTKM